MTEKVERGRLHYPSGYERNQPKPSKGGALDECCIISLINTRQAKKQYKLMIQYVELAAKNDDRRRFKKGIEWAQYVGIKVRWLRDDEPTEKKLDYV